MRGKWADFAPARSAMYSLAASSLAHLRSLQGAEPERWAPAYISLSSRISSMVWTRVKSPSLLSDTLLPRGQAAWPWRGRAPATRRPSSVECRSCPPWGEGRAFCSLPEPVPSESFLGHFSRNRKFFPRTQALQPEWWASKKRAHCFRSSAFTCQVRRGRGYCLGATESSVHSANVY